MPTKHDRATQEARIRYIAEKRKRFTLNLAPEEFDSFRSACERNCTTPTTEIRRFMAEYAKGDQQ